MRAVDSISQFTDGPTVQGHAGVRSTDTQSQSTAQVAVVSSISTGGSTSFVAAGDATLAGASLSIGDDLNISATDIKLLATQTQSSGSSSTDQRSTGLALSASGNSDNGSVSLGLEASGFGCPKRQSRQPVYRVGGGCRR
jgi:filamentous hemagglutinin